MKIFEETFEDKVNLLKETRFRLLKLHKLLIDIERQVYERKNGQVSSGQFLQLLLNDANFSWLRKFSTLIVEIDEMFDLNDGFTEEMIDKHFSQLEKLLVFESPDNEFNAKYQSLSQSNSEVSEKHCELEKLLMQK